MRVPQKVRVAVIERDAGRCCICSQYCLAAHVHHRQPRGMGGTSSSSSYAVANLLTLCSTCHLVTVEPNRAVAELNGWVVRRPTDPAEVPVMYRGRWVRLDNDGGVTAIGL